MPEIGQVIGAGRGSQGGRRREVPRIQGQVPRIQGQVLEGRKPLTEYRRDGWNLRRYAERATPG